MVSSRRISPAVEGAVLEVVVVVVSELIEQAQQVPAIAAGVCGIDGCY
jgi:hypothetical protein